jgi:hypothetical protein
MRMKVYKEERALDAAQPNEIRKPTSQRAEWFTCAGLLLLGIIPIAARGAVHLAEQVDGAEVTLINGFFDSPLPVVLHVLSASVYAILGTFQFATGFRRRMPGWHRAAGLLLVLCGLAVGLTGVWLTLLDPLQAGTGELLLYVLRLLFGSAMIMSIILGFVSILRGDVVMHRAWMMRSFAIGLGAGTQLLTLTAGSLIIGPPSALSEALLMGAAWVINLAVAERAIRRRTAPPARMASIVDPHLQ